MNRREASKTETKQLILSAAQKLFIEMGVEKCTMRAIAKEAGVSPASVVVHFKNKTALLEAALYGDIENTLSKAYLSMPERGDLLKRLMHLPAAMYAFYDSNRNLYRSLIRNTVFEPEEENPLLTQQMNDYMFFLGELIEHEKIRGKIRPDIDAHITASSLASLYFGVLILFFRNQELTPETAINMLTSMTSQYLKGIERG